VTTRAARGPYRKGQERRREIVAAAAELFAESGYASTSMRELAQRVGLTPAGLLHHFASKDELLTEVLGLRQESLEAALAEVPGADMRTRAREVARHGAENAGLTSLFVVLSAEATAPDHPAHAYFAEHYRGTAEVTQSAMAAMSRDGEVRADASPVDLASLAVAVLDGLQLQQRYRPDLDVESAVATFWRLLDASPAVPGAVDPGSA
jgi:AcrR family transcriptional regulator